MPAPAVSPTVKTLLRYALTLETAATGTGLAWLNSVQAKLAGVMLAGGQKMVSASTASKSFAFMDGWSTAALGEALEEAFAIWNTLDSTQLGTLLNTRPITTTRASFGYCPR